MLNLVRQLGLDSIPWRTVAMGHYNDKSRVCWVASTTYLIQLVKFRDLEDNKMKYCTVEQIIYNQDEFIWYDSYNMSDALINYQVDSLNRLTRLQFFRQLL